MTAQHELRSFLVHPVGFEVGVFWEIVVIEMFLATWKSWRLGSFWRLGNLGDGNLGDND